MARVHELVAEHDRHLVVVHVVEEAREHVDRVVAHGEGVPLLVLDHVDAHGLRVEVRREQGVHDAADPVDLRPLLDELPDARLLLAVALRETALLARLGLRLVGGGA